MLIMNVLSFVFFYLYTIHRVESVSTARQKLRADMEEYVEKMSYEQKFNENKAIREKLFKLRPYKEAQRVGIYLSRPEQVDTDEILKKMVEQGKKVFIPKQIPVDNIDMVLINGTSDLTELELNMRGFRAPNVRDRRLDSLDTEREADTRRYPDDRGITYYPPPTGSKYFPDHEAPMSGLDLLIIPGFAFTAEGKRMGGQKGYFDRYVKRARVFAKNVTVVGLAFKHQIVPVIPDYEYPDINVDIVLHP